ncbi:hypothetical protein GCM10023081_29280 [Arthrobacter ginkgonis]|uniref:Uncharacterized protein n=1 Tax=Arthrobacter ginkgonis TaxID=1630594 RepID=A0ABP7CJV9_9MICC
MSEQRRRHLRNTPTPVVPANFVHIERPANRSLGVAVAGLVTLSALALAVVFALVAFLFTPEGTVVYVWAAAAGAALGAAAALSALRRSGRSRREDFVRCGGDPTGMSDLMFGVMRGRRAAGGTWEVPPQGSGDYV